jgi:hypothetical protein
MTLRNRESLRGSINHRAGRCKRVSEGGRITSGFAIVAYGRGIGLTA